MLPSHPPVNEYGRPALRYASVALRVLDRSGGITYEHSEDLAAALPDVLWLYPRPEYGSVEVTVSAPGMETTSKTIESPRDFEDVAFAFATPHRVAGSVYVVDEQGPAEGVRIILRRGDGFTRSGTSDSQGRFDIATLAGTYRLDTEAPDSFAAMPREERDLLDVGERYDTENVKVSVCRSTTVRGVVKDKIGYPMPGVQVRGGRWPDRTETTTDDKGEFELTGIPSKGTSHLWATLGDVEGQLKLSDPGPGDVHVIVLGYASGPPERGVMIGDEARRIEPLIVATGKSVNWSPSKERSTLAAFCSFWRPAGREMAGKARAWAAEQGYDLALFSTDSSLELARRGVAEMPEAEDIMYVGYAGLEGAEDWDLSGPAHAYVITSEGRIEMPEGL